MGPLMRMMLRPNDRGFWIGFAVVGVILVVVVPLLNLLLPVDSPLHVPNYMIPLIGKFLCYALLAVSLDLVWGYCGVLSLGHGAFFTLGGYAMGMYMMRAIGPRGVYGHATLPDFMVFLNWKELPWYWLGFDSFGFALLMALVAPAILAFVLGWFAFRSRITGVYLSIITQAMTFALMLAFFRNEMGFGGNNGLTDFKDLLGYNISQPSTKMGLYVISAIVLGMSLILCRFVVASKLGRVMMAVRDAESRVRFLGYSVTKVKLFGFTLSAVLAGVAGALYVPQVGIINPSEFSPANSIEVAIWVAVGGRGTLVGPILGAFVVNGAKTWLTGAAPEAWLFFLGALFIIVTLLLPKGIVGLAAQIRAKLADRKTRGEGPGPIEEKTHA
jgi:urea transport system permease protein